MKFLVIKANTSITIAFNEYNVTFENRFAFAVNFNCWKKTLFYGLLFFNPNFCIFYRMKENKY